MTQPEPDVTAPTHVDDRRPTDPGGAPPISSEPLVEPPSLALLPLALVRQRSWLVGGLGLFVVGLLTWWRRRGD